RRTDRLKADEAHLARRVRELVRADRGKRDDRTSLADASAPRVRGAVRAQQMPCSGNGPAEIEQEARRGGIRLVEHVIRARREPANLDGLAVRVDQAGSLVQTR